MVKADGAGRIRSAAAQVIELPPAASRYGFSETKKATVQSPAKKEKKVAGAPEMKLRDAKRQVFEFGTSGLSKRARQVVEAERIEAFGGKAKKQKMPLKMVLGIRRAEAKRAALRAEERRTSGVVAPKERQDALTRKKTTKRKRRAEQDDDVKDGIFRVSPALLSQGRRRSLR